MASDASSRPQPSAWAQSELTALLRINQVILKQRERGPLFAAISGAIGSIVPSERVLVLVPASQPSEVDVFSIHGASQMAGGDRVPEGSVAAWVIAHGQSKIVSRRDDVRESFPVTARNLEHEGMESLAVLPLRVGERTLGALGLMSRSPGAWDRVSLPLLEHLAGSVAVALDNCLAYEQRLRMERQLRALLEVNAAVGRHLRRDELFGALASCLGALLPTERFGIELPIDGKQLQAHVLGPLGERSAPTRVEVLPAAGTACDWVQTERRSLVAETRAELRERFPVTFEVMQREAMQSLCALPLVTGKRCRGVLFFMAERERAYSDLHRDVLEQIAGAVAIALDNCLAHEEVERLSERLAAENVYLQEEIREEHNFGEIVGRSAAFQRVLAQVDAAARTRATMLILGETGTGKELVARAIHERSPRSARPLVKVNCAAISAGLVESELFGHVKGAFTGALTDRSGRFELADGGTLFLDEIGELPLDTQVKLLRVLQEHEFEPVGSNRTRKVDVRLIAATNRDLEKAVAEGRFRQDLFFRLNVVPVRVPALRERKEDIALLVQFFAERYARELGKRIDGVSPESMQRLVAYEWPGNVRELQNLVERAVVLAQRPILELAPDAAPAPSAEPAPARESEAEGTATLEEVSRRHLVAALERAGWVIEGPRGAASMLGMNPNTLRSRLKKLGLHRPRA